MVHLDLFSGIGGFAYAVDQVWDDVEHIFCDNDKFCQQVLKKHWAGSLIYDDIRNITDTEFKGLEGRDRSKQAVNISSRRSDGEEVFILTGGFPCQPFSAAGLRRGTADERHLWPEMLRVIKLTQPQWVIAENVRGLLTWNEGLVFESVCTDLESSGYAVWPLIIPAVAVNAPHRRDRVWFVAHRTKLGRNQREQGNNRPSKNGTTNGLISKNTDAQDAISIGSRGWSQDGRQILERQSPEVQAEGSDSESNNDTDTEHTRLERRNFPPSEHWENKGLFFRPEDWHRDWLEVATWYGRVDDGLPAELDGFKLSKSQHRKERLKSLGNAIVPQVAIEIMQAIKLGERKPK